MAHDTKYGVHPTAAGPIHWLVLDEQFPQPPGSNYTPYFLNNAELGVFASLKADKRRRDWLMGRLAGKLLIAEMARGQDGRPIALDEISILPHPDGRPVVSMPSQLSMPPISLSLSHTRERAFCAAVEGEDGLIGADAEYIEPRRAGFTEEYFTPLELQFLAAAPHDQRTMLTNAVWSGKEAALKAIGRGLAEATKIVTCLPHPLMPDRTDWLPMRIEWAANRPMPPLTGVWRLDPPYVMTLAFKAQAS